MSPTIWVHATTMNPYLQYMRLYENNRVEFHNKLKDSIGTVAERVFLENPICPKGYRR